MRPDRVIPPGSDPLAGGLPLYGTGFSNPLMGNPRSEPSATLPALTRDLNNANSSIGSGYVTQAPRLGAGATGAALADSTSTTSGDVMAMLQEHWPWLVVAVLVGAAIIYEES